MHLVHLIAIPLAAGLAWAGCTGYVEREDGGLEQDGAEDAQSVDDEAAADDTPTADDEATADEASGGDEEVPADDPAGPDGLDGDDPGPACTPDSCPPRQWCHAGACVCQSGWLPSGADCAPILAGDPATRSAAEVCARWSADYPQRASGVWTPGADACAPGAVDPQALDDGIRRLNLWRWLVGLEPTYNDRASNVYAQACAVLIRANGQLSHSPPDTWACYSPEGAAGAGHCNEAMGAYDPASAMDLYIWDGGVPSLGHRRWLLDPPYLPAGMGHAEGYNCTYVMTGGNGAFPPFLALPPPGPVPRAALVDVWSVGAAGFEPDPQVSLRDLTDGSQATPAASLAEGSYGSYAYLAFRPGLTLAAGHDYEVSVTQVRLAGAAQATTLTYRLQVVDCP